MAANHITAVGSGLLCQNHTPNHAPATRLITPLIPISREEGFATPSEYCQKQGWAIAGEYVDHETGGTSKRKHFQRMFADARQAVRPGSLLEPRQAVP